MRCRRIPCAAMLIALALSSTAAPGDHKLAFSKRMGVTVLAEGEPNWCDEQLRLKIDADSADFFESPDLAKLVRAIGTKVLPNECEAAATAQLVGIYQGAAVWQGSTSKQDGWTVQVLSAAEPAPVEVPVEPAQTDVVVEAAVAPAAAASPVAVEPPPAAAEAQAPEAPPATDAVVAAGEAATTAADFAVQGWTPKPVLHEEEGKLDSVASEDKGCAIHYSVRSNDKGLVYLETDVPCVDGWIDGSGKAVIKRVDGKQIARLNGNFSRGFFTGDDRFEPERIVGVNTTQPNNLLALLKADSDLKAYYLGNVAVIGANRWGFCHFAQVRLVTEDQDLFLKEEMIDLVVENAATLVAERCPKQRRFQFSAGTTPWDFDRKDHTVSYYVTQVHQDRRSKAWSFNKTRAWNGVIAARIAKAEQERREQQRREREAELARQAAERQAKQEEYRRQQEQQRAEREAQLARQAAERQAQQQEYLRQQEQRRAEQAARAKAYQEQQAKLNKWRQAKGDYDRLMALGGVGRLAYQANVSGTSFPLDLYARQAIGGQPVGGAVLVRVSDDEGDHAIVDWPVSMRLDDKGDVIDDEGVYFVIGRVTGGERRADALPMVTMEVDKAWRCQERLCNEHGDVLSMVKVRHDYPEFDPDQQPEQPKWQ